jgi:4-amino-4-deoxy-L-arabinose transferase-like glycosyltransferase
LALALAILIQFSGGILDHSLWTPDEPRVAEIAREMSVSGDYLIPHLSGKPFLEQPPLYYALAALPYKAFGTGNEGVGRIASLLFALGTILIVFFSTRALFSGQMAALSVLILATSFKFLEISHKMIVDNALCFFITAAMFAFVLAYKNIFKHGYKVFWIGLSLAFLAKGLIGIAIPAVGVSIFILYQRDLQVIKKIWAVQGIILILCTMAAWGWVLYTKGGTNFLSTFFVYNQFGRFLPGNDIYHGGHIKPFYYYFFSFWGDAAPWSVLLIPAFIRANKIFDTNRYMNAWFLGGFFLLCLASTKRGSYLLPLYPAMAVVIARWMTLVMCGGLLKWEKGLLWVIMTLVFLATLIVPTTYIFLLKGPWWLASLMIVITSVAILYAWRHFKHAMPLAVAISWAILLLAWTPLLYPQIDQVKSYKGFFTDLGKTVSNKPLIGYHLTETMEALCPFYGGVYADNIQDKNLFEEILRGQGEKYAVVQLKRQDDTMKVFLNSKGQLISATKGWGTEKVELWGFTGGH